MDNQSNQFKLLDMRIALLETKVDKLQRDVSFMHSWSKQGAPPKGRLYASVVTDKTPDRQLLQQRLLLHSLPQEASAQCGRRCPRGCAKCTGHKMQ